MLAFLRKAYLTGCAAGGVYGAWRLLEHMVRLATDGQKFVFNSESMLVAVPILAAGAVAGLLVGSLVIPRKLS
jgi:hypothetical protein